MDEQQYLRLRIKPLSAFGSVLKGDTLFGQLCWAVRNRFGEDRLLELLQGYVNGRPFVVLSDGLPEGYIPRPALPLHYFHLPARQDQKQLKRLAWIPSSVLTRPLEDWLLLAGTAQAKPAEPLVRLQPHNSIDRRSGTTGTGEGFAPYTLSQRWYADNAWLEIYAVLDTQRLSPDAFMTVLNDVGQFGFGRDASIGLGKFELEYWETVSWPESHSANAGLTLAPCAPQGLGLDSKRCFYNVFTRFGRHGDRAVHQANPFKAPVLLVETGAVLKPLLQQRFVGQGLGGSGQLSKVLPQTVHQGYAPLVPIRLPELREART
ncbi:MAG: CRISPR-associated protein Csm7 [Candidatus Competibacteraceae bacterium]|nr:CRISPR-associated protein Csm7 [Candidatus Competibacteraceae bacterium]MCB1806051.1 CRISPR-associated protein Csm7 [Candidatus Competibacteraceae bacterium]MCB1815212.1 CRISPR-associated protein Csm7 [Candidatus Competibacteraceae bacterium]